MKRILFVIFEGGGNVPPQLGIARRLVARGHAVRVLGDGAVEAAARAAGCEFAPFRNVPHHNYRSKEDDRVRDWATKNPLAQLKRTTGELMFGPAAAYARELLDELERFPADALAIDWLVYGALIGAEKSGLPTAAVVHMPYPLPTEGLPPFGLGFRPARGPLGRFRDRLLRGLMMRAFEQQGRAPVQAARAGLGLPPLRGVFDQVLRADRVLVLTARQFDFAGALDLPPQVRFVGPQLDDPQWADAWTSPWPEDARDPLVLVGLGSTFQDQGAITRRVIEALGGLPVRGLVTLGGVFEPADFSAPRNVAVVRSAPHAQLMPAARAVVAHGGHGTVMKALGHGAPVLCIPLGRDQKDNAVRVEVAGAGLRLAPGASVATLRRAIGRLLDEPRFAEAARRLAADIARDGADQPAVLELEQLASRGPSRAVA